MQKTGRGSLLPALSLSKKSCSDFFEVADFAYYAPLRRAAKPVKCENLTVFIRFGVHAAEAGL